MFKLTGAIAGAVLLCTLAIGCGSNSPGAIRVSVNWKNTVEDKLEPDEETIIVLAPADIEDDLKRMYAPPIEPTAITEYQDECRKKGGYAGTGKGGVVTLDNIKPGKYGLVIISTRPGFYSDPAYLSRTKELMKPFFNSITLDTTSAGARMHFVQDVLISPGKELAVKHTF